MKILYVSVLSSQRLIQEIYKQSGCDPGFAIQKFSRMLAKGFVSNGSSVRVLSNIPISSETIKKKWINIKNETEDAIEYHYFPFLNIIGVKNLFIFIQTFFYVLFWGLGNKKDKTVFCDVLSVSGAFAALLACKITRLKCAGLVTDAPSFVGTGQGKTSKIRQIKRTMQNLYLQHFTHYVYVTEAMDVLANPQHRPYIVMECLCDNSIDEDRVQKTIKANPRTILYAGGLYEIYGLKTLVEGFLKLDRSDAHLVLYGSGTYVEELKEVCLEHPQIEYRGVAPNEVVVQSELESTLLVNPRFTTEEYTKYSFPSKNMEFMVSGTPLLTTKLPGMPKDYYPYVFLIEEETIEGYAKAIADVLEKDADILRTKGNTARQFVLKNKNNKVQAARVLALLGEN